MLWATSRLPLSTASNVLRSPPASLFKSATAPDLRPSCDYVLSSQAEETNRHYNINIDIQNNTDTYPSLLTTPSTPSLSQSISTKNPPQCSLPTPNTSTTTHHHSLSACGSSNRNVHPIRHRRSFPAHAQSPNGPAYVALTSLHKL